MKKIYEMQGVSEGQTNPFTDMDPDRAEIWEMLVTRDIDAFVAADWSKVAGDFDVPAFFGIDGARNPSPDNWKLGFPDLETYKTEWLRQAEEFSKTEFVGDARAAIFAATNLTDIELNGDRAIARKKFDGSIRKADGSEDRLLWQTLYFCTRKEGRWKICSFIGYLPNPLGAEADK
jgi:hypothetical protein